MDSQVNNFNINCSSYTFTSGQDSIVKVLTSQIPVDNINFSIYVEPIHFDSDEAQTSKLWLLQPYPSGNCKLAILINGARYELKYDDYGDKFNRPICIESDKFITRTSDPYITVQVVANYQDYSTPPDMTIINNKIQNIRFIIEYSTPFVKY